MGHKKAISQTPECYDPANFSVQETQITPQKVVHPMILADNPSEMNDSRPIIMMISQRQNMNENEPELCTSSQDNLAPT